MSKQSGHMARGNPSRERSCGAEMSKKQKQAADRKMQTGLETPTDTGLDPVLELN